MALDDPSAQLQSDIEDDVQTALSSHRPIIHHLNADTTWFLQIPRPAHEISTTGRLYFNVLIDPWLDGGQSDVASWFSQQFHATPSAVRSIAALEELAREVEILADGDGLAADRETKKAKIEEGEKRKEKKHKTFIDAVAVSHEFTDHCHRETLMQVDPSVPVFAIKEAARTIRPWKHFKTVVTVNPFGASGNKDWRITSLYPLPSWIGISRLLQTDDVLNYHAALLIAFNNTHGDAIDQLARKPPQTGSKRKQHSSIEPHEKQDITEAIVYTPHGISSGDLNLIPNASPPIKTLAFLHGLHNVRVGNLFGRTALQSNLGAHNGLKAQRILNAKYWIGTHDEIKTGGGLVSWFLQRDVISLKDALEEERRALKEEKNGKADVELVKSFRSTNWLELGNGESRVLV